MMLEKQIAKKITVFFLGIVLVSCGPQKNTTTGAGIATLKIGCGARTGIALNCADGSGVAMDPVNLDVTFNCSADEEVQSVNVNTDLGGTGLTCSISNPVFVRGPTILNAITAIGSPFESDAGLKTIPRDQELEWSCVENYNDDTTRDLNRSYHFITFQKAGTTVTGTLENRNEYLDYDRISETGSSSCTFSYSDL